MAEKKDIMTVEEIGDKVLEKNVLDAYKFAINSKKAPEDSLKDFVVKRGSMTEEFRKMAEIQKWATRLSDSLKAALKMVYGIGPEDMLPENVSWDKVQYTYSFAPGAAEKIAKDLIEKGETTESKLFETVTVTAMAKVAGVFVESLMAKYPGSISAKAKERVIHVK